MSIYYEALQQFIVAFLPLEINVTRDVTVTVFQVLMDFWLHYFEFMPSMLSGIISLLPLFAKRAIFYEEPTGDLAMSCISTVLWMILNMIIVHLVVTKVGMIYIDAEVLREGNTETLDNLEEGVIILDEKTMEIKFQNEWATDVKTQKDGTLQ